MKTSKLIDAQDWIALMLGNSRSHWAWFSHETLRHTWDTPHLSAEAIAQWVHQPDTERLAQCRQDGVEEDSGAAIGAIVLASVVPSQTVLWQVHQPFVQILTLDQIPLTGIYSTLGIDRALALWGAIQQGGAPLLVIDGGTALTLTAADATGCFMGGAILPGLALQRRSLSLGTAALPDLPAPDSLPPRWATTTPEAMHSGILYTLLAGLQDFLHEWHRQFPQAPVWVTGGDGALLIRYLQARYPRLRHALSYRPYLIFEALRSLRRQGKV